MPVQREKEIGGDAVSLLCGQVEESFGAGQRPMAPSASEQDSEAVFQERRGDLERLGVVLSDLETAVRKIKYGTHRYARQQYTWFRLDAPAIRWFDVTEGDQTVVETLAHELRSQLQSG